MSTAAISTEALTKDYGRHRALDGLSLTVERGEVFGFLGPNGAGKTTAIRLLLDLIRPSAGSASILGFDCRLQSLDVRRRTGYLPGDLRLYQRLRGRDLVSLIARLRHRPLDTAWVDRLRGLLELDLDRHIGAYSKGTRQKLGVLVALLDRPPVLLLDEPTSGLDPLVQRVVWQILEEEARRGTTVFFSSHVMSEVEQVCERVGIVRAGRLVAIEPIAGLKARALTRIEATFAGTVPGPGELRAAGAREVRRDLHSLEFEVTGDVDGLIKALAGHHVSSLRTEQASLDDIVLGYYRDGKAG